MKVLNKEDLFSGDAIYRRHDGGVFVVSQGRLIGASSTDTYVLADDVRQEVFEVLGIVEINPQQVVVVWENGDHRTCVCGSYAV
jgi:hypothetical protein